MLTIQSQAGGLSVNQFFQKTLQIINRENLFHFHIIWNLQSKIILNKKYNKKQKFIHNNNYGIKIIENVVMQ